MPFELIVGAGLLLLVLLLLGAAAWGWRLRRPRQPLPLPSAVAASPAADPVKMFGRWCIERPLGSGAMGQVYLGRDPASDARVAIKTLALARDFEGAALDETLERFMREAATARRLRHPDIVSVIDAGQAHGLAWIAMEFVDGHDLSPHTVPGSLLPPAQVVEIVARVALALAHAHRQGVVHRDIKPANVLINSALGTVKVADFGIARDTDASRTRTGRVLGTPSFMSPEQMAGLRVDGRSDLYSLGVTLFQLLTGALPHQSESMARLMFEIANVAAPDIRTLRPELPEALANVVALALQKRSEVRYADGRQMADDLRAVAHLLAPEAAAGTTAGPVSDPDQPCFAATAELSRADPRHNSQP